MAKINATPIQQCIESYLSQKPHLKKQSGMKEALNALEGDFAEDLIGDPIPVSIRLKNCKDFTAKGIYHI